MRVDQAGNDRATAAIDAPRALGGARGVLCYATVDGDIEGFQREARAKGVPLFGATPLSTTEPVPPAPGTCRVLLAP